MARTRTRGFTLVELMIVLVVIAVLAAIALPSYQTYVIRAKRAQAQQFMQDIANREEQFRLDARTYTTRSPARAVSTSRSRPTFAELHGLGGRQHRQRLPRRRRSSRRRMSSCRDRRSERRPATATLCLDSARQQDADEQVDSDDKHAPRRARLKGFTLVELIVTVTIVGIVAALAVPSMREIYPHAIRAQRGRRPAERALLRAQRSDQARGRRAGRADQQRLAAGLDRPARRRRRRCAGSARCPISFRHVAGSTMTYRTDGRLTAGPAFDHLQDRQHVDPRALREGRPERPAQRRVRHRRRPIERLHVGTLDMTPTFRPRPAPRRAVAASR